jgi:hypothetical protein
MLEEGHSAASFAAFVKLLLGNIQTDGLFQPRLVPLLSFVQGVSVPSAATPLDFIDVECAGVSAGDPRLNVLSQLIELDIESVLFFHWFLLASDFARRSI